MTATRPGNMPDAAPSSNEHELVYDADQALLMVRSLKLLSPKNHENMAPPCATQIFPEHKAAVRGASEWDLATTAAARGSP